MALLQNKLNLRVSQKQILTPGLVQMVSVLALNKLELKDMITAEIVENPVLEEIEESSVSLEEIARIFDGDGAVANIDMHDVQKDIYAMDRDHDELPGRAL